MQNIRLKVLFSILIVFLVVLCDIYTKQMILNIGQSFILNSFIKIHMIENYGIAFSLFDNLSEKGYLVLNALIITIILFIFYELYKNIKLSNIYITGLSLILGGGISNLFDRYDNGSVTDFIILYYEDLYFPAIFNIADLSISIGALLVVIYIFFYSHEYNQIQK